VPVAAYARPTPPKLSGRVAAPTGGVRQLVLLQAGVSSKRYRACSFLSEGAESRSKPESRRRGGAGWGVEVEVAEIRSPMRLGVGFGEALGHQHYRQSALLAAGTAPAHGRPVLLDPAWGERLRHDHFIPCDGRGAALVTTSRRLSLSPPRSRVEVRSASALPPVSSTGSADRNPQPAARRNRPMFCQGNGHGAGRAICADGRCHGAPGRTWGTPRIGAWTDSKRCRTGGG
jgi:hypothetical protein